MTDTKCPFSMIQSAATAHCQHAREVVRRGGVEYDCTVPFAHETCEALVCHLNAGALPALGYEDDLTQTPKSVYERILVGGLQGLQKDQPQGDSANGVGDVWGIVEHAQTAYERLETIPIERLLPFIEAYKPRRRQRKRP